MGNPQVQIIGEIRKIPQYILPFFRRLTREKTIALDPKLGFRRDSIDQAGGLGSASDS
jgi:hypothetical protein